MDQDRAHALLLRRIEETGLSNRRFAEVCMVRDERTVRRWIAREGPIPKTVIAWLESPPEPWPPRNPITGGPP